ncbi:hypothetical protein DUI87_13431 [Hirundo rustica rustica]|uniref:Uncharacterized protein n=1 Tax=Hirundo rustica rustica TaxID=333673 RepID=A0A3M0K957_HIRRU|nr:hypothetical protein DUI87_13431 [Hirundo rustica rustica]
MQASVRLHMDRSGVHLELIAPGVETQPQRLPWTDPRLHWKRVRLRNIYSTSMSALWGGNTAMKVFEKRGKIIQILLEASFTIKKSKVKGPAREIQFLGVKWQNGHCQIPTEVINKITVMSPPTKKKETPAFLSIIGF